MKDFTIDSTNDTGIGRFTAMACPCEILVDTHDLLEVETLTQLAFNEAIRIEKKFSRYRTDNIIYEINHAQGRTSQVDEETALLLDFANQCYELSEGMFDITSGALGAIWKFNGENKIPSLQKISDTLKNIGWKKVTWNNPDFTLLPNMEIDFGGIGKEYAVDACHKILSKKTSKSYLVNFGGDIVCSGPRKNNQPWFIGIETPYIDNIATAGKISLYKGGLATSGDSKRFLIHEGVRYSHILNPVTGYPVAHAPRSISVAADSCIEAGMMSTFAMLQGDRAIEFLKQQNINYWCIP